MCFLVNYAKERIQSALVSNLYKVCLLNCPLLINISFVRML